MLHDISWILGDIFMLYLAVIYAYYMLVCHKMTTIYTLSMIIFYWVKWIFSYDNKDSIKQKAITRQSCIKIIYITSKIN